ncbi:hypothetical protein, unknown function [Leishmania infantum JPCM5]|uniref:Uncharacterized protein n=2 Tax=Leishmania infantum TaxID=5671 RepID=A4HUL1_LEIIN|nr:hypothetical protein, unknown function [Leishmania infantum JPCM5]CAC9458532.1 hypothetical_protein_-_conserved [Leishmania infantum]CAM66120.2 hypothetical protein, unknown function [Leishmania infantum JPCM5]SUZ39739.1 hypothetical_protein_-_conserved [Leishmania infantum]|eukprot:XP_001463752.2 hypothetical protein, unknown function [Leishmania infantum JPCM5]
MNGHGPSCSAIKNGVEHRYAHVKWFHAVNSQAALLDAARAIDQMFYDKREGGARGSEAKINHGMLADKNARGNGGGGRGNVAVAHGFSNAPACTAIGIEADIQWHPTLETAIMRRDPLPSAVVDVFSGDGDGNKDRNAHNDRSPAAKTTADAAEDGTLPLEAFLQTLAEAVKGWRQRAAFLATAPARSPAAAPPLRVIVRLHFEALPAAQQLLTHAEAHTWAGLEELCWQPHSEGSAAAAVSGTARQHASLSVIDHSADASATPCEAQRQPSMPVASHPPAAVAIELWWSADVVAQSGVTPHPLSFAAAPASVVQGLMARTAQVLGPRVPLGFSLGWVLCPRAVPAEVLAMTKATAASSTTASATTVMPQPRYVFYSLLEDAAAMKSFLDGLWKELDSSVHRHSNGAAVEPGGGTALSGIVGSEGMEKRSDQAVVSASAPPPASRLVRLITFTMMFESVFADVYTAKERQQAFEWSVAATASLNAAARKADETRRVAVAVLEHTTKLFSASHVTTSATMKTRMSSTASKVVETEQLEEESLKHAAVPTAATMTPSGDPRAFPTFRKAIRPPSPAPLAVVSPVAQPMSSIKIDDDGAFQLNVDRAARVFFPCCSIDT